jgi:anti-sigma regulatory factor (Ser/Thr protein kinase)/PAS domain-containing protein
MEAVINSMSQGVLILDPSGSIVNMNPSAMRLFRISRLSNKNNRIEYLSRKFGTFLLDGSPALSVGDYLKKVLDNEKIDDLILHVENRITGNSWIGGINTSAVLDKSGNIALIVLIISDITERVANEQKERELERHKLEFYKRTIQAATNGKLVITDGANIQNIAGKPYYSWQIDSPESITDIRHNVTSLAKINNMDENRIGNFIIAVGEVSANVYKHARVGNASIHITPFSMIYLVCDKGTGIDALNLPDVALRDHFSTAGTLGMGYKVMLSFCDKVYLSTSPNGTTVAIEMRYKDIGNAIGNEICNFEILN